MPTGFLGLPWPVWGGLALLVALLFAFVVPTDKAVAASGVQAFLLRWGHALVWVLLSLSFFARSLSSLAGAVNPLALAAGLLYLIYLATLLTKR